MLHRGALLELHTSCKQGVESRETEEAIMRKWVSSLGVSIETHSQQAAVVFMWKGCSMILNSRLDFHNPQSRRKSIERHLCTNILYVHTDTNCNAKIDTSRGINFHRQRADHAHLHWSSRSNCQPPPSRCIIGFSIKHHLRFFTRSIKIGSMVGTTPSHTWAS